MDGLVGAVVKYIYPTGTATTPAVQPHALTSTTRTPPTGSAVASSYGYDKTGNTTSRPGVKALVRPGTVR